MSNGEVMTALDTLTVSQLAKRWHVDQARIHALVRAGFFPGAFRIPSAGRFGETTKIPLADVLEAQKNWAIQPIETKRPKKTRGGAVLSGGYRNFPELNPESEPR
jgi:hypothetical protein